MDQLIINKAVKIATKMAMDGHPCMVIWEPGGSCDSPEGSFCIMEYPPVGSTDTPSGRGFAGGN